MSILSFKEFTERENITEMAIAGYGNWVPSTDMIGTKSAFIVRKQWHFVQDIITKSKEKYGVYKSPTGKVYIAGKFITTDTNEEVFEMVFSIKLTEHKSLATLLKINTLMNVDGVQVHEDSHGDGIAVAVYKLLVQHENITILGDEMQYFGARKLWARLSKILDVNVDIVDISIGVYLEKNVTLHHGHEDEDYDERVYGKYYKDDKKHIRLLLNKIIN